MVKKNTSFWAVLDCLLRLLLSRRALFVLATSGILMMSLTPFYLSLRLIQTQGMGPNSYNQPELANGTFAIKQQPPEIDRIYYINLPQATGRRASIESWLNDSSVIYVPYERVEAMEGEANTCVAHKNTPGRCRGLSGLAKTEMHIIDNLNTTGITLVIEDDKRVVDLRKMHETIQMVPDDWDIIRWRCWGDSEIKHSNKIAPGIFKTSPKMFCPKYMKRKCMEVARESRILNWLAHKTGRKVHETACNLLLKSGYEFHCGYCGGTGIMVWRDEINGYCVNIEGVAKSQRVKSEASFIPKE